MRSELKTRVKAAVTRRGAPAPRTPTTPAQLAQKRLDKAAAKGVIHKNAGRPAQVAPHEASTLAAEQS